MCDEYRIEMNKCRDACVSFVNVNTDDELDKLMLKYVRKRLDGEKQSYTNRGVRKQMARCILYSLAMFGLDCARQAAKH